MSPATESGTTLQVGSIDSLLEVMRGKRIAALVGAGCSTDSGIPDYRGPQGSLRTRRPMQYSEFIGSAASRARYWARSAVGWPRLERARPNIAHECLARLEAAGALSGIITQNVDGLHQKAGSRRVVELHGSLAWTRCLSCGFRLSRSAYQAKLLEANPFHSGWLANVAPGEAETAPDGDAEVPSAAASDFAVPPCEACGGIIKPDVVFFGENVPRTWVDDAWRVYDDSDVLFVIGSSLTVYSGRRFLYRAEKEGKPVLVANLGPTRGDDLATVKCEGPLSEILPALTSELVGNANVNDRRAAALLDHAGQR